MNNANLTINMCVYNEEEFIEQSITSLLSQTYEKFILNIFDNASTDNTSAIVKKYALVDDRIRVYSRENNVTAMINMQEAFANCNTEFFMYAAGHDIYHEGYINACMLAFEDSTVVLSYTKCLSIDTKGNALGIWPHDLDTRGYSDIARVNAVPWLLPYNYCFYGVFRYSALKNIPVHDVIGPDNIILSELAYFGNFAQHHEALFYLRKNHDYADPDAYLNKLNKNFKGDPDFKGIYKFIEFISAMCSIADRRCQPFIISKELTKINIINMCIQQYAHTMLGFYNLSIDDLLKRQEWHDYLINQHNLVNQTLLAANSYLESGA